MNLTQLFRVLGNVHCRFHLCGDDSEESFDLMTLSEIRKTYDMKHTIVKRICPDDDAFSLRIVVHNFDKIKSTRESIKAKRLESYRKRQLERYRKKISQPQDDIDPLNVYITTSNCITSWGEAHCPYCKNYVTNYCSSFKDDLKLIKDCPRCGHRINTEKDLVYKSIDELPKHPYAHKKIFSINKI